MIEFALAKRFKCAYVLITDRCRVSEDLLVDSESQKGQRRPRWGGVAQHVRTTVPQVNFVGGAVRDVRENHLCEDRVIYVAPLAPSVGY